MEHFCLLWNGEQQGRLYTTPSFTAVDIGCSTPQEIRHRIMDVNSDFQKKLVGILESVVWRVPEPVQRLMFLKGLELHLRLLITLNPLSLCQPLLLGHVVIKCGDCSCEKDRELWWQEFESTVDDVLLRSNQHTHKIDKNGNNISYCMTAKVSANVGFLEIHFHRHWLIQSSGALSLKKGEAWMNSVTPLLSYLLPSNSDVTSLLSGTAIKAVVAYCQRLITKPSLKTYIIFECYKKCI